MKHAPATIKAESTVVAIMTTDLVTLKLNDTLRLADDLMNLADVRHFPVLDGDRLVGIINQNDLLHASMASFIRHPKDSPRAALGAVAVRDVMKSATTVAAETSLHEAARIMVDSGADCLLVSKDEKLVGLVSRTDLLRAMARG
jgi:CBS domain-containing membrane protein